MAPGVGKLVRQDRPQVGPIFALERVDGDEQDESPQPR